MLQNKFAKLDTYLRFQYDAFNFVNCSIFSFGKHPCSIGCIPTNSQVKGKGVRCCWSGHGPTFCGYHDLSGAWAYDLSTSNKKNERSPLFTRVDGWDITDLSVAIPPWQHHLIPESSHEWGHIKLRTRSSPNHFRVLVRVKMEAHKSCLHIDF